MLTKKYIKSRKVVKVTFEIPDAQLPADLKIGSVNLVGDFNDWDHGATPMKRTKGVFKVSVDLSPDKRYEYRYLVNGEQWVNDWAPDDYVPNDQGTDNCVVVTPAGP